MNTPKPLWPVMGSCLLVIVTALSIAACAGPAIQVSVPAQVAEKITKPDVLQTCAVLGDQDMTEIRGCYDNVYAFGLDFVATIDMANVAKKVEGGISAYAVAFNGGPLTSVKNATSNSFDSRNGDVHWESSIGTGPLGTGVIQLVQVRGNNNLVFASTNVTLNIEHFQPIKSNVATALGALRR